ncbi:2-hydroxymuconate tautomerase family protein [Niveispirillum sp.]|uniref:tautomerase family protein n=2 Tax=Niveispirillum TaxID=1543704 RepID=UPI001B66DD73|nr:2-hydroxymuconate tautomerase family protein [Niveispirillum sp.]MBP7335943.1 2-hydroxymuconate tautomerase family protein [Niveispirillum sp.]
MPLINVQIISGRTDRQKRDLMRGLAQAAMDALDVPEKSVRVILTEVPATHWGIGLTTKADEQAPA